MRTQRDNSVYLAGQISGLSYDGANDWRIEAEVVLGEVGIKTLNPLRCKQFLAKLETISGHGNEYKHMGVLATSRGVMTRDRFDATRCGVLFANLLGMTKASVGTTMEIAWGDMARIPIVAVMEESGNPMDHMMVNEAVGFRVPTLVEGYEVVKAILL